MFGKKPHKPFQQVQKPLECLSQSVGENTILMLCLNCFLLVISWCCWLDPSSDNTKGYLANARAELWKHEMEVWCSAAEGCRLAWEKLKARSALITWHVLPLIKQNCQSAECFMANHFSQRKKVKLMNLGKENSVFTMQNLSYSWGTLYFSLPGWTVIINLISQQWLH